MWLLPMDPLFGIADQIHFSPIDDWMDKLSCVITASIYLICAIFLSIKTEAYSPIECWMPRTYSKSWVNFAKHYCFIKDTYWIPTSEPFADISADHKARHRVTYYQWSSLYLTVGSLTFMFPQYLWKAVQKRTCMSLKHFCKATKELRTQSNPVKRADKVSLLGRLLREKIFRYHARRSTSKLSVVVAYGVVKFCYILIVFVQFIMLSVFLDYNCDIFWGWKVLMELINGDTWETTGHFPRVTFCDFDIALLGGNVHHETIECLIGLNEFNEKIYIFLWFWLVLVFFFTVAGAVFTIIRYTTLGFVKNLLHAIRRPEDRVQKAMFRKFGDCYLTMEGKLVLSFIKYHSEMIAQEVALSLYKDFLKNHEPKHIVIRPKKTKIKIVLTKNLHLV